jgi:hypothetical protein
MRNPSIIRVLLLWLVLLFLTAGCNEYAGQPDGGPIDDAAHDAGPDAGPDGGSDAGFDPCNCPEDRPVEVFHACTPPLRVGCEAKTCIPGEDDCGPGEICEECAAAACCICSACVPACVPGDPAMGPLPEYLKLWTNSGPPDQEHEIVVQGFPFYVGALFYLARVGDSEDLMESSCPQTCARGFLAPAHGPGTVPVWVSQYGGAEPWVLAGFFSYTSDYPPACVQPGFPCVDSGPCCQTADVPVTCTGGRCRMER